MGIMLGAEFSFISIYEASVDESLVDSLLCSVVLSLDTDSMLVTTSC